jgi:hypothetical protein
VAGNVLVVARALSAVARTADGMADAASKEDAATAWAAASAEGTGPIAKVRSDLGLPPGGRDGSCPAASTSAP